MEEEEKYIHCTNCGTRVKVGTKFCTNCGKHISGKGGGLKLPSNKIIIVVAFVLLLAFGGFLFTRQRKTAELSEYILKEYEIPPGYSVVSVDERMKSKGFYDNPWYLNRDQIVEFGFQNPSGVEDVLVAVYSGTKLDESDDVGILVIKFKTTDDLFREISTLADRDAYYGSGGYATVMKKDSTVVIIGGGPQTSYNGVQQMARKLKLRLDLQEVDI